MSSSAENITATANAGLPRKAWRQVDIEAPATLELYGPHNMGHLTVKLVNNSDLVLQPRPDGKIAFSFKLLNAKGKVRPFEGIRTPLTQPVQPGTSHTQTVTIMVPPETFEGATAVRVGLLHEGEYWVESLSSGHPCTVQIVRGGDLNTTAGQVAAGDQIWERGKGNGLRWPYGSMMVSEKDKLLYIPVAKCACTSLKSMMVELAEVDRPEAVMGLGVHFVTDRFNTGVQLKDKPIDLAREILASDQYFKFSVIRDPFERLVSAYLEKFVYKRANKRNLVHTQQVVRNVQGDDHFDPHAGISFDQFVEYILRHSPHDLDPHWRPQYLYFLGVRHLSRIFRLENIDQLEQYLLQHLGIETQLGHANANSKSDLILPDVSELIASELDERGSIDPRSFLSSKHAEAIREYYREDFEFYNAAV